MSWWWWWWWWLAWSLNRRVMMASMMNALWYYSCLKCSDGVINLSINVYHVDNTCQMRVILGVDKVLVVLWLRDTISSVPPPWSNLTVLLPYACIVYRRYTWNEQLKMNEYICMYVEKRFSIYKYTYLYNQILQGIYWDKFTLLCLHI